MQLKNKSLWKLLTSVWCCWSNFRFRKCERFSRSLQYIDTVTNLTEIRNLVDRLYDSFIWTADDITQLYDAITPPPENYKIYLEKPLKDDCDGFHSLIYHCLYNSGIECYLLTANPAKMGDGHCILIFKYDDKWYINDYYRVYEGFSTAEEAIADYNPRYSERYKTDEVVFNGVVKYDYVTGKFSRIELEELK